MEAPCQVLTAAQMRAAEQVLIGRGETVCDLMERVGRGAAEWVWRMAAGRPVTVLCGPGNNGGDGYVIACVLAMRGLTVAVVAPLEPTSEAARAACEAWGGTPVADATGHVLVDCLLGTGLTRPLSTELHTLLSQLASAHERRIAIDLPSGVESDTGEVLNEYLPGYHLTIALGAWKRAHWLMPAMQRMGERRLVELNIGEVAGAARLAERPVLRAPPADAHKYTRGLLAVIGGEMPGAGALAARAAMRSGAGYVKLFAPHRSPATPDELVVDDAPLEQALADERVDALLIGPGLGRSDDSRARLNKVLRADLPTICDGDALHLLTRDMLAPRAAPLVLTPHEGELAALCDTFGVVDEVKTARVGALASMLDAVVVGKGPDTIIAAPGEPLRFTPPAASWLSTAGTGDVLAGIVASRLAYGGDPMQAAVEGVHLHAEAAHLAGAAFTPSDLIGCISEAYTAFL